VEFYWNGNDRLKQSCREDDMVFRIGGDEFLLILTHVPQQQAEPLSQQVLLRLQGAAKTIPLIDGFSIGLAYGPCNKIKELIHTADLNMYTHKKQKR